MSSHCFSGLSTPRFKPQHRYTSQMASDLFPGPGSPVPHRQGDFGALVHGWRWAVGSWASPSPHHQHDRHLGVTRSRRSPGEEG